MNRRQLLLGTTIVLTVALTVPALGGPSNPVAETAASLKKKVNRALATANSAQSSAAGAQSTAAGAQSAADTAQSAANTAQAAANAATAAAANARSTAQAKQDRIRWAFVSGPGTIPAQSGGISLVEVSGGNYTLDFGSSQVGKALLVSPWGGDAAGTARAALCGGSGNPGGVTCTASFDDTSHLRVSMTDIAGTAATRSFYLLAVPQAAP